MAAGKGAGGLGCLALLAVGALVVMFLFLPIVLAGGVFIADLPAHATCRSVATSDSTGGPVRGVPAQWADDVQAAADTAGLPVEVIAAQIGAESGWDPQAVSPAGAVGLSQFMPGTWAAYGDGDPTDPEASIAAQGKYMAALMDLAAPHADGDADRQVRLALAAYNWGDGNMTRNGWALTGLPGETSAYLTKILDGGQLNYSTQCQPVAGGAYTGDLGDGEWAPPLPGGKMTGAGAFGGRNVPGLPAWAQNHVGIDLATEHGGKVVAPTDLRITALYDPDGCVMAKATTEPAFGFAFCHLDGYAVTVGQKVKRGDILGDEGTRATSVGVGVMRHLHTELYRPEAGDPKHPGPTAEGILDPTPIYRAKGAL